MFDYSYSAWSEIQSDRTEITSLIMTGTIPSNNAHNILLLQNSAKFRWGKKLRKNTVNSTPGNRVVEILFWLFKTNEIVIVLPGSTTWRPQEGIR